LPQFTCVPELQEPKLVWTQQHSSTNQLFMGYAREEDFSLDADPQIPAEKLKQLCCVRSLDPSDW